MFQIGQWEIFEAGSCVLLLIILWTHSYLLAKLRIPGSFCTFPALVWHSAIYPSSGSLNREWYNETKIWASVCSSLQESHHFQALSAEKAAWCLQVHTHTHIHKYLPVICLTTLKTKCSYWYLHPQFQFNTPKFILAFCSRLVSPFSKSKNPDPYYPCHIY